jgi:hypothetical protein
VVEVFKVVFDVVFEEVEVEVRVVRGDDIVWLQVDREREE